MLSLLTPQETTSNITPSKEPGGSEGSGSGSNKENELTRFQLFHKDKLIGAYSNFSFNDPKLNVMFQGTIGAIAPIVDKKDNNVGMTTLSDILFNKEDKRFISNDKSFVEKKDEFVKQVISNDIYIDKYSVKIIAEAKSFVTYQNKKQEISVFLNQQIENNGVKWVILNVKADFLDVLQEDTVLLRFIPPTSNETNFISLGRVFNDKGFQHYYMHNNYRYDQLSTFLFAINTGLINYNYVNEIIYHIYDMDGWHIQLKEFNRNSENSGWLIDDLSKTNLDFNSCLEKLLND